MSLWLHFIPYGDSEVAGIKGALNGVPGILRSFGSGDMITDTHEQEEKNQIQNCVCKQENESPNALHLITYLQVRYIGILIATHADSDGTEQHTILRPVSQLQVTGRWIPTCASHSLHRDRIESRRCRMRMAGDVT